jgi:hypothetical protein
MKTQRQILHDKIRERLKKYRTECLLCLNPTDDYTWGCTRKNVQKTLALVNKIMKNIPATAWPTIDDDWLNYTTIVSGNWKIVLSWSWKTHRRLVDLSHKNNDHTAWVIEHKEKHGEYINFDIGGS